MHLNTCMLAPLLPVMFLFRKPQRSSDIAHQVCLGSTTIRMRISPCIHLLEAGLLKTPCPYKIGTFDVEVPGSEALLAPCSLCSHPASEHEGDLTDSPHYTVQSYGKWSILLFF